MLWSMKLSEIRKKHPLGRICHYYLASGVSNIGCCQNQTGRVWTLGRTCGRARRAEVPLSAGGAEVLRTWGIRSLTFSQDSKTVPGCCYHNPSIVFLPWLLFLQKQQGACILGCCSSSSSNAKDGGWIWCWGMDSKDVGGDSGATTKLASGADVQLTHHK